MSGGGSVPADDTARKKSKRKMDLEGVVVLFGILLFAVCALGGAIAYGLSPGAIADAERRAKASDPGMSPAAIRKVRADAADRGLRQLQEFVRAKDKPSKSGTVSPTFDPMRRGGSIPLRHNDLEVDSILSGESFNPKATSYGGAAGAEPTAGREAPAEW